MPVESAAALRAERSRPRFVVPSLRSRRQLALDQPGFGHQRVHHEQLACETPAALSHAVLAAYCPAKNAYANLTARIDLSSDHRDHDHSVAALRARNPSCESRERLRH